MVVLAVFLAAAGRVNSLGLALATAIAAIALTALGIVIAMKNKRYSASCAAAQG